MRLRPLAYPEVGNQDPGPGDVEVEGAELLEAELQEHLQTVGPRVPVVFFEEIDGFGQEYAVAVGDLPVADLQMTIVSCDTLGEQGERPFDIHEVRHGQAASSDAAKTADLL